MPFARKCTQHTATKVISTPTRPISVTAHISIYVNSSYILYSNGTRLNWLRVIRRSVDFVVVWNIWVVCFVIVVEYIHRFGGIFIVDTFLKKAKRFTCIWIIACDRDLFGLYYHNFEPELMYSADAYKELCAHAMRFSVVKRKLLTRERALYMQITSRRASCMRGANN